MRIRNRVTIFVLMAALAALTACGGPDVASGIYDPLERQNRAVHEFNRDVDRALLRPTANAYGTVLPEPVRNGVGNVAANLSLPGSILNDLLQFNIEDAMHNSVRLIVNSTIGLGGLIDVAQASGVPARNSDFGETLHVWGAREGAYLELPFVGPSTTRDTVGMVVDLFIDPLNSVVPPKDRYVLPVVAAASKIGDRYRFKSTVDSILYESADSYAQARLLYLENRRFQLGAEAGAGAEELYEDLYEGLIPE